jgi:hypothetical protein
MPLPLRGDRPPASSGDPAEAWVRFAKLLCLFPRESTRVREAARAFRASLETVRQEEQQPCVALMASGQGIELNGRKPEEMFGPTHAWLAERFRRSALSSVEFLPEATEDGLASFTLRLLENFTGKQVNARFESLWPETFPGIRPVELSFAGGFPDAASEAAARLADALCSQDPFIASVLADKTVTHALADIVARSPAEDGIDISLVIERIREKLPAEIARDPELAREVTTNVLRSLLGNVRGGGRTALEDLLAVASGNLFARQQDGEEGSAAAVLSMRPSSRAAAVETEPLPAGIHEGDAAIAHDLPMFLAEYRRLPAEEIRLSLEEADLVVEQLAVYLHFLLRLESSVHASAALEVIFKLVESSKSQDLEVLASYLSVASRGSAGSAETIERLGRVLQEGRVLRVLEKLGVFGLGWAIATFPETFPFFLDSLDLTRQDQLMELCIACESIGAERILAASRELAQKSKLLRPFIVQRICAVPFKPLVPLVATILRYGNDDLRPKVALYLRGLYQDGVESCLLWLYEAPEDVPKDYMLELMSAVDGAMSPALRRIIGRNLCRIALLKGLDPATVERRVRAIELMPSVPTSETSEALVELVSGAGLPRMSRPASRIREAARNAVETLKKGSHV